MINEKVKPGFENTESIDGELFCTFKGYSENFVYVGGKLLKENQIVSIPIIILRDKGQVLLKGSNTRHIKTAREFIMDKLELERLYYSVPTGIKDEGADHRDFNGRARDFVAELHVEEVNGVFLKVGGTTRINKVAYMGKGDILEEKEIKDKIRGGDLMTGVKGYIRYNDLLIDFTIKWGWFCQINVRGQRLSEEIINTLLKRISSVYKDKMLR